MDLGWQHYFFNVCALLNSQFLLRLFTSKWRFFIFVTFVSLSNELICTGPVMSGISVECLKKITFSLLPLSEKLEIITRGRPTPNILIQAARVSKTKKFLKSFNHNWYEKIKWLCGCETTNALFCFPCLLFGGDTVWTQNGFTNISKMKEKTGKHQNSRRHRANMMSLSLLSQINISEQLDEASEIIKNDKQVKEYREELYKIIDCLKLYAKFQLTLRHGHHDLYNTIENFLSNFNPDFKKHLLVFGETSESLRNDLLGNMLEVCRQLIVSEVQKASYVAVICEDVGDISENIQAIIAFRYGYQGMVHERFWGFLDSESVSRDGVSKCLLNEISRVLKKDWNKLIAQTFNGPVRGEVSKIQKIFQNAHFIHSCSSELELILKHMTRSIKSIRLFFANLASLDKFFKKSPTRLAILYKHINGNMPKFESLDICTVYRTKNNLIQCLEDLMASKTTDKTFEASARFLSLLKSENFLFWLEIFDKIIFHLQLFYQDIQSVDPFEIPSTVQEFCKLICKICNSVSFGSAGSCKILECQEVSSLICDEMKERFAFIGHLTAANLFRRENFNKFHLELPKLDIKETCRAYPDIMEEKLKMELRVLYSEKKFHNLGVMSILNSLNNDSLLGVFSETIKLLKILVTTPMVLNESVGCFSTVKKVKSLIRDRLNEEKLTALCMISVESEMVSQIDNFNEKVVQRYCDNGKTEFGFK